MGWEEEEEEVEGCRNSGTVDVDESRKVLGIEKEFDLKLKPPTKEGSLSQHRQQDSDFSILPWTN